MQTDLPPTLLPQARRVNPNIASDILLAKPILSRTAITSPAITQTTRVAPENPRSAKACYASMLLIILL